MRLWTLHPKYLDRQGLLGLWREGLLAQAVLQGKTKGYRHHPQLARFQKHPYPVQAIVHYLKVVQEEAARRGYNFDVSKIKLVGSPSTIDTTAGQLVFEFQHLLNKLAQRSLEDYQRWQSIGRPYSHPSFRIIPGEIEPWEKV
jgi:hypothetical protein